MKIKKTVYEWAEKPKWLNLLLSLDQLGNVFFSLCPWPFSWPGVGNPDRTISYTLGKLQYKFGGKIPWKYPLAKIIAAGCDFFETGHCFKAYINET